MSDSVKKIIPIGAFADAADEISRAGFVIMPVGSETGKKPLVTGFTKWTCAASPAARNDWKIRFPHANVGIVCGASGIVVVDVDDNSLLDLVLNFCGQTPLVVVTPSGGFHCYYRDIGETKSANLRRHNLDIDIKARGGFVVAPPSINPKNGHKYVLQKDLWIPVQELPDFPADALSQLTNNRYQPRAPSNSSSHSKNKQGERNAHLFEHLRHLSPHRSLEHVIEAALEYNQTQNEVPEDDEAVIATAKGVWNYQQAGSIKKPNTAYVTVSEHDEQALAPVAGRHYPDCIVLLIALRRAHGGPDLAHRPFAITSEAMAKAGVVSGIKDPKRITRARTILEESGHLIQISIAGPAVGGARRPALYKLSTPTEIK